jgi:hypothetical protein
MKRKTPNTKHRTPKGQLSNGSEMAACRRTQVAGGLGIRAGDRLPEKNMILILAESEELIRIFFASVRATEENAK